MEAEGPYSVLGEVSFSSGEITLRAVRPSEIEQIRVWRNNQTEVLRQSQQISKVEQERYFRTYVWPEKTLRTPNQILLSILSNSQIIGYGGLTNICWENKRAEVSFLLEPVREEDPKIKRSIFTFFLARLFEIGFVSLGLNRIFTETYAFRGAHISMIENAGFVREGTMRDHVQTKRGATDSIVHGILARDWKEQCLREPKSLSPAVQE